MKKKVSWCNEPVEVPGVNARYLENETAFQIYVATWLRKQGFRFHHSANERVGGKAGLMARLKGQSRGFPDLMIFCEPRFIAIELKYGKGKSSPEQDRWLAFLASVGFRTAICRSFDEVVEALKIATPRGKAWL